MERNEISEHEIRLFKVFKDSPDVWFGNRDVATRAKMSERTVRAHTLRLVKLGLLDQVEVFPSHRYRLSKFAEKRNKAYLQRLALAEEVFSQNDKH